MNKREYAKLKKWTDTLTDDQHTKQYGVYVPDDLDMGVLNYVYEKDIVGWMPVSDLDKIEPLLWAGYRKERKW